MRSGGSSNSVVSIQISLGVVVNDSSTHGVSENVDGGSDSVSEKELVSISPSDFISLQKPVDSNNKGDVLDWKSDGGKDQQHGDKSGGWDRSGSNRG